MRSWYDAGGNGRGDSRGELRGLERDEGKTNSEERERERRTRARQEGELRIETVKPLE